MFRRVLFFFLTLTVFSPVSVLAYASPGTASGYINDFAHVLTADQVANLEQQVQAYEASTTNEIAVVTIPDLGGDTIENYANKLFTEWGIGKQDKNNGVLIIAAINDRKMRIEVGYGLEPDLTDLETQQIQTSIMQPAFRANDYFGGLSGAVSAVEKTLSGEQLNLQAINKTNPLSDFLNLSLNFIVFGFFIFSQLIASVLARSKSWWGGGVLGGAIALVVYFFTYLSLAIAIAVVLIPIGLLVDYLVSKSYSKAKAEGRPWIFMGGGRGGSGGGGFGGFGGGSSGGGGSSSSW